MLRILLTLVIGSFVCVGAEESHVAKKATLAEVGRDGAVAIRWAASNNHTDVVTAILNTGLDPNARTEDGTTALAAASSAGHVEVARILLDAGAKVETQNDLGFTPLMFAALSGQVEAARLLLTHGASINARNKFGSTPLMLGVAGQRADVRISANDGSTALTYARDLASKTPAAKELVDLLESGFGKE